MKFHPQKCSVISTSRSRSINMYPYKLHGHTLVHEDTTKYLGVTISSDLRWTKHIDNISGKANSTLGFLKRNLQIQSRSIKSKAYMSLVRPSLEYASCAWDPYTQKDIAKVERVQRRAARYCLGKYHNTSSVTDMLETLEWPTLQKRRKAARLCMLHKINNQKVKLSPSQLKPPIRSSHRHHSHTFQLPSSLADYRKFSFYPRTIQEWNSLPDDVVSASSLESFRARLDRVLQ